MGGLRVTEDVSFKETGGIYLFPLLSLSSQPQRELPPVPVPALMYSLTTGPKQQSLNDVILPSQGSSKFSVWQKHREVGIKPTMRPVFFFFFYSPGVPEASV